MMSGAFFLRTPCDILARFAEPQVTQQSSAIFVNNISNVNDQVFPGLVNYSEDKYDRTKF
jgi:hypothetical protein